MPGVEGADAAAHPLGEAPRCLRVVRVPVRDEHDVAAVDLLGRPRAQRIREPGVDEHDLVARRPDLDAGVSEPRDRRPARCHGCHLRRQRTGAGGGTPRRARERRRAGPGGAHPHPRLLRIGWPRMTAA